MHVRRNTLIHLHHIKYITRHILHELFIQSNDWQHIYSYTAHDLGERLQLEEKKARNIYGALRDKEINHFKEQSQKDWKIITIFDTSFPKRLRQIPDPPYVLYAWGNLTCLQKEKIMSVIGSRHPSHAAQDKVNHIVPGLVEANWIVASGFAMGIDSMAHRATIRNKGATIAVLGGGFHHLYPKQHSYLFEQISKNGAIISEYPPHIQPQKYHFPERNRIISGLSLATIVMEAKEKSGTMITVDQALEQGKEVYAVPGNPLCEKTIGCHRLIQDGAKLITNAEDILVEWDYLDENNPL